MNLTEKIFVVSAFIFMILIGGIILVGQINADPPHPRLHYKWEPTPAGQVILYFYEDRETRYIYEMEHEAEPATPCMPHYTNTTFRLVTWDMAHPYYYTMKNKPSMVWDDKQKAFVMYGE